MIASSLRNQLKTELIKKLGPEKVFSDPADCWAYGYDYSRQHATPDLVVQAYTHHDVVECIKSCQRINVPVTARGYGTGTPGGAVPIQGGVVLSLEKMNRIIDIDPSNRTLRVEPGVINQQAQLLAKEHGFFWPPDPSSSHACSIGGNLAYNSAGPRAVKYGTPRENTLGLRAVTALGDTIHTGVYTTKGVVGYDLTRLLIGSEGTLAIITEAVLKLTPLPETVTTIQACYSSIEHAALAVSAIMAQPVIPCALEFMDGACIDIIQRHHQFDFPDKTHALLMIEIDGQDIAMPSAIESINQAANNTGFLGFKYAKTHEEKNVLWQARKSLSPALRDIAPKKISEDIVVPVSKIAEFIMSVEALGNRYGITIVNFGHAGNGNIHVNLLINPDDKQQLSNAKQCLEKLFEQVIALNGTISGEHGIGLEKREYIGLEIDPVTLGLMQKIKQQFDPNNILNPGKIFP